MAKLKTSKVAALKSKRGKGETLHIAFSKKNYTIIGIGLLLIIFGYVLMTENSVDGFMPTVVAPIMLFFGYCVFIPLGILFKDKSGEDFGADVVKDAKKDSGKTTANINTTNIKTS
ncbi:MAG: DUF3098 domain-containing protein [Ignavibacteriaceae bacterium]|jgi:Protein of unknown function (DUF3098).|nr:MAG: DUF3098 domain-containing protein [Chlorobiota bacterium]KXK02635.1 MAG: hypothetical protein UZ04_CHB001001931 [Chlorobi bacterium OLB4]MBV6398745.1 hypothetical protein [Ignavibacteria bacterium]MCC6885083.1 DUF3098 domain-containing protein [Ignavibacteriales bacterium]MCE7952126.1 DUF3098 domain-containing protein [Chlorobi bacterium CHB7]MDL1886317.1 DUF3098 domain-containing protein [Ignavibacteria bacterium CHB1]MEB2329412.1 DUF3098 domain-containing protein [Ignavibacteriaceae